MATYTHEVYPKVWCLCGAQMVMTYRDEVPWRLGCPSCHRTPIDLLTVEQVKEAKTP